MNSTASSGNGFSPGWIKTWMTSLPDSGARNIDSLLDQQILPVLSRELLLCMAEHQMPKAIRLACSQEQGIVVDFDDTTP